jgi:PAS domain S-box-containing protein
VQPTAENKDNFYQELDDSPQKIEKLAAADDSNMEDKSRFKLLLENLKEVFWLRDAEKYIYVSPSIEAVWGLPCQHFYDNPSANFELMHPEDRQRLLQNYSKERFFGDEVFHEEFRIIRPDGEIRWISSRSFPIKNQSGKIIRRAGICEDITERKQYEILLKEREEQLYQIIRQTPFPIEIFDNQGTVVMANKAFLDLYKIPDQSLVVGRFNIFKDKLLLPKDFLKHWKAVLKGQTVHIPELTLSFAESYLQEINKKFQVGRIEDITVEMTIFPVFTHKGEIWRVVTIRRDISPALEDKKKLEQKNIALKELLTQIEIEKIDIKNMIKTNIDRLVLPYLARLSQEAELDAKGKKYLELAKNNLLNISSSLIKKIKENYVSLSPREIEICDLIRNGFSNKEIANTLSLSLLTVEKHRQHIRKKFGIAHEHINLHTYLQQIHT